MFTLSKLGAEGPVKSLSIFCKTKMMEDGFLDLQKWTMFADENIDQRNHENNVVLI